MLETCTRDDIAFVPDCCGHGYMLRVRRLWIEVPLIWSVWLLIFVVCSVCYRAVASVSTAVCLWSWLDAGSVNISVLLLFGVDCVVHGGVNRE